MQPPVHRETAVHKLLRVTLHGGDFMCQRTQENHRLILLRNDRTVGFHGKISSVHELRVVQPEVASLELLRFAMEEINKRDLAGSNFVMGVIAVPAEIVSVIAGSNLHFHLTYGERAR